MAKEIWNEGRVVGYSAYEIYVKQHLANSDPDVPPVSEAEWLSASLAMGSSLLLKIPDTANTNIGEDTHYTIDITLPKDSRLGAANTIIANFFDGDAVFPTDGVNEGLDSNYWASKVTSYGNLIPNNSSSSPSTPGDGPSVPKNIENDPSDWSDNLKAKLVDYMKIVDGVVIQPGEWYEIPDATIAPNSSKPPQKDEKQDLTKRPFIRLRIKGRLGTTSERGNLILLLTGFTIRSVLSGITNTSTSTSPELRTDEEEYTGRTAPEDGDFLGPMAYPWANKIIFSVPSSYIAYFMSDKYKRQIPNGTYSKSIKDTAVIDMNKGKNGDNYPAADTTSKGTAIDPHWFYTQSQQPKLPDYRGNNNNYSNCEIPYTVDDFSTLGDGTSVLTVYEKKRIYPPALYGTFVQANGEDYLTPLDCVAPGSVKMFIDDETGDTMKDYEDSFPGTVSMNKDSETGEISTIIEDGDGNHKKVPIASVSTGSFDEYGRFVRIKVGNRTVKALAVAPSVGENDEDPTEYPIDGTNGTILPNKGKFSWRNLTQSLTQNKVIDVLKNGLSSGDGIDITGDGPYIITNIAPLTKDRLTDMLDIVPGDGIGIESSYVGDTCVFKIINTAPNDTFGKSYHYINAKSNNLNVVLCSNFCGALDNAAIKTKNNELEYYNFLSKDEYVNGKKKSNGDYIATDGVRIGVDCNSLTKNKSGTYDGVMYFNIDFTGQYNGKKTLLANKNMSYNDDNADHFRFCHSQADVTLRAKQASIMRVKFVGSMWGDLSSRTAYWNSYKNSLWNLTEVYNKGTSSNRNFVTYDPGCSFFPSMSVWGPQADNNPYKGYFTLYASSYYDGYNNQLDRWEVHGGHIYSRWLNMNVAWACNVKGVNKSAILAL